MSGLKQNFSKILVAIDGSRPSMDAVDYAIAIAQRNDAELTALYVVSSPTTFDYTSDTPEDQIPEIATLNKLSCVDIVLHRTFHHYEKQRVCGTVEICPSCKNRKEESTPINISV